MQALKFLVLVHVAAWFYGAAVLGWMFFQAENYFRFAACAVVGGVFLLDLLGKASDVMTAGGEGLARAQKPWVYFCQAAAGAMVVVPQIQDLLRPQASMVLAMIGASAFAVAAWQLIVCKTGFTEGL